MTIDYLKEKKELVGTALLAVSLLSAILIAVKVAGFYVVSANAESTVERALDRSGSDDKSVAAQLDKSRKVADALKKQNLFIPEAQKQHPVNAVLGILGDEALINGRWYKTGDKVADARIVAVEPTSVTIEWDGKTSVFNPIDSMASSGPSGSSKSGRSTTSSRKTSSSGGGKSQMIVTKSDAMSKKSAVDKVKDPEAKKAKNIYDNMSDSQKELFKRVMKEREEQYNHMSDSEKKDFKTKIIERISQSGKK